MKPKRIIPLFSLLVLLLALWLNADQSRAAPAFQSLAGFNILLSRPTNDSVTVNVIPDQNGEISFEYGTASGVYGTETSATECINGEPVEVVIDGLTSNTESMIMKVDFMRTTNVGWKS